VNNNKVLLNANAGAAERRSLGCCWLGFFDFRLLREIGREAQEMRLRARWESKVRGNKG